MAYSKAKLKSNGDRESPCFRPFLIGNAPDKCLPIRILLLVSFKHILISLTSFLGITVILISFKNFISERRESQNQMLQNNFLLK
jgi:hypothetical protein